MANNTLLFNVTLVVRGPSATCAVPSVSSLTTVMSIGSPPVMSSTGLVTGAGIGVGAQTLFTVGVAVGAPTP